MRLWTVHPKYLDAKGLVALWREALLAQKVLLGKTKGYRHHPQLIRFQAHINPVAAVAAFLSISFGNADFASAALVLLISSVSFIGIGMMTAVLPLISPEKGTQLGFIAQGLLLVVSGVYYPVTVLPDWMQWLSVISPATYTLEGCRNAILDGASVSQMWPDIWPLLLIGGIAVPLGLAVFRRGERYAKQHGRLKRSG